MILYIRPVPLCGETSIGKKISPIRQPSARLSAVENTLRSRSHHNNNSSWSSVGSLPWLREDLQVSRRLACGSAIEPGFSHGCCQSLRSWRGPTGPGPSALSPTVTTGLPSPRWRSVNAPRILGRALVVASLLPGAPGPASRSPPL